MRKKEKEIELPNLTDWLVIDEYDIIDLYKSIIEQMRKVLGDTKLYIVWKDSKEYKVFETEINNIKMVYSEYHAVRLEFYNNYIYDIHAIYSKKEFAERVTRKLNIKYLEEKVKDIQKKIEKINPIKILEEADKQKKVLLEEYTKVKDRLEQSKAEFTEEIGEQI